MFMRVFLLGATRLLFLGATCVLFAMLLLCAVVVYKATAAHNWEDVLVFALVGAACAVSGSLAVFMAFIPSHRKLR